MKLTPERKAERKARRLAAPNNLQVGDILHYSWGYDQTNCDFFQVTARTAKTVSIREIKAAPVPSSDGFMSRYLVPMPGEFVEGADEIKGKLVQGDLGNFVKMDYGNASKIAPDQKCYSSWYA